MQIIKNRERIGAIAFQIGFLIELLIMVTDHAATWTIPYRGRLAQIAFALFCIKIVTTYYSPKQWIWIISLGIIGTISYFLKQDEYVIRLIVMAVAIKNEDIYRMARITFTALSLATITIVILSLMGIGGKVVDIREYRYGIVEARYCLGFNHANNIHGVLWYLTSLLLLIRKEKKRWLEIVALTILNVLLLYFTRSRTGFILTQLVIILFAVYERWSINRILILKIMAYGSLLLTIVLTLFAQTNYEPFKPVYELFDRILSGRLGYARYYQPIEKWTWIRGLKTRKYVDNGFNVIAYRYGIIIALLLVIWILALIVRIKSIDDCSIFIIVISSIIMLFMESSFIINISMLCTPFVILSPIIWRDSNG